MASDELETKLTDEEKRLKQKNAKAYNSLILSMDTTKGAGRVAFGVIKRAKTDALSGGDARLAWKNLLNRYEPKTAPSRARLQRLFFNAKCRRGEDPSTYITYLEDLRNQILDAGGEEIGEEQLLL